MGQILRWGCQGLILACTGGYEKRAGKAGHSKGSGSMDGKNVVATY